MVIDMDSSAPEDSGPGPECTVDRDCDDGLECNGTELCAGGSCASGRPITCDDDVACTNDYCDEPGICRASADDSACADGEFCDLVDGCAPGCPDSPCRLVGPQCGCRGGDACYLAGTAGRVCAPPGTAAEGDSCSSPADCAAGTQCINISSDSPAVYACARFCDEDSDCVGAGSACELTLSDGGGGSLPARLCTRSCHPVDQTGCPEDSACAMFSEGGVTITDCVAPPGTGTQGDACEDGTECAGGFVCIDPDGTMGTEPSQCMHWCEVVTGDGCASGESCFGFVTPLRLGGTVYGVCDEE
jgi:hypothetical protein